MCDPSTVCLEHLQACGLVKWVAVWFGWLLNWGRRWLMREHALITDQCLTRHCDHMWAHTHTFNFWGQACSFSSQSPSLWGKNHHPCGEVFWNFPPPARSRLPGVKMLWSSWDIVCLQIQFSQSFIRLSQAVVGGGCTTPTTCPNVHKTTSNVKSSRWCICNPNVPAEYIGWTDRNG